MGEIDLVEEYLARAAHAEEFANKVGESFARKSWLAIAQGYRELAELQSNTPFLKQPSLSRQAPPDR